MRAVKLTFCSYLLSQGSDFGKGGMNLKIQAKGQGRGPLLYIKKNRRAFNSLAGLYRKKVDLKGQYSDERGRTELAQPNAVIFLQETC